MKYREEIDLLGTKEIPQSALWGVHTARALENFPYKGERVPLNLIKAVAEIKQAAAKVNCDLGYIPEKIASSIILATVDIINGNFDEQFPIAALQGGAGTSTNMCVNEVVANRALQILGENIGDYSKIHPIETVNLHQSTNDVYPTALKIATIRELRILSETVACLQGELQKKETEYSEVVTVGRTQLQDAVPMTMGAQFASFAQAFERDRWRCFKAEERVRVVNIGGTAIGTGITAPRDYIFRIIETLRENTGLPLSRAEHLIDATANQDPFVEVSAILLSNAVNLIKVSRDLRQLHSLNEISLKKLQSGSSIMPGKVNPVALEAVITLSLKVKSNNNLLAEAVELGTLQINEFMPLIATTLLESINLLIEANQTLCKAVAELSVNEEVCRNRFEKSEMLITAFIPHIGYKKAEELAQKFSTIESGISFKKFLEEELGDELVSKTLKPSSLMALGFRKR
jgi:aspartate ammonia-lyase